MKLDIIYNEDCIGSQGMRILPDKSIDMILCDMPYGTTACKWDTIISLKPLWEQLKRIIKPSGAIVLTASQPFTTILISSNMKMFKYCWVWIKNIPTGFWNAKRMPMKIHEDIVVFYGKQPVYNPQMVKRTPEEFKTCYRKNDSKSNAGVSFGGKEKKLIRKTKEQQWYKNPTTELRISLDDYRNGEGHSTQKPIALMEYLIKTYTNEGDIILDFAIGSGTTAVACIKLSRRYIGYETNKEYCQIAKQRLVGEATLFNMRGE